MLSRHERRRLEGIEARLLADDPDFADKMTAPELFTPSSHPHAVRFLVFLSIGLAFVCACLEEGAGCLLSSGLAIALILIRDWKLRAE